MLKHFFTATSIVLVLSGSTYLLNGTHSVAADAVVVSQQPHGLAAAAKPQPQTAFGQPLRIAAKSIGLNVEVVAGFHDLSNNDWMLDADIAFYVGNTGTPFVYGHNIENIFAKLIDADVTTDFEVIYENSTESYSYVATRFVEPSDISVLNEKNDGMIMLMTCSGAFNEVRRIVYLRHDES